MEKTHAHQAAPRGAQAQPQPDHGLFKRLAGEYSLIRLQGLNVGADPKVTEGPLKTRLASPGACKKPVGSWKQYQTQRRAFNEIGFQQGENAGIVTGEISNLLVLDIDNEELFKSACEQQGWTVPETFEVTTGKGRHLYFNYPQDGRRYRNIAQGEKYGIDARGDGGYVVAPGSVHLERGTLYRITSDIPKVDPPQWLMELCEDRQEQRGRQTPSRSSTTAHIFEPVDLEPVDIQELRIPSYIRELILEGAERGKRSEAMWSVIHSLVTRGLTDGQILWVFDQHLIGTKAREHSNPAEWLVPQIEKVRDELSLMGKKSYEQLPEASTQAAPRGAQAVTEEAFLDRMQEHWKCRLGNEPSEPLREAWRQLCRAFNLNIYAHHDPEFKKEWHVVQAPTGSGKTEGMIQYASLLSPLTRDFKHPGVLIVTRLIKECDRIAEDINKWSGAEVAIAYHSEAKVKPDELRGWPVVVVTHRAYELALEYLGKHSSIRQTWPLFHTYLKGTRNLVVVDESFNLVVEYRADISLLKNLQSIFTRLPYQVRQEFKAEAGVIETIINILERIDELTEDSPAHERLLLKEGIEELIKKGSMMSLGTGIATREEVEAIQGCMREAEFSPEPFFSFDFTGLSKAIRDNVRIDRAILLRNDPDEDDRLKRIYDKTLRSLNALLKSWLWYARTNMTHTLNTARLLIPEDVKGAVILDATASTNVNYELANGFRLYEPVEGVRNYQNVTVHIARGYRTGKGYMEENAPALTQELMDNLQQQCTPSDEVFVICHKDVEPALTRYSPSFTMKVGHWGAVDGSNEWQHSNKAVVFGLPHLPDTWAPNHFMAHQGPQNTEWFTDPGKRSFNGHKDIRKALKVGHLVTEVIQAVNRIRCRRVIDSEGNCPEAEVYLRLPDGEVGHMVIEGIRGSMPGVNIVEDWELTRGKAKVRPSKFAEALMVLARNMEPGDRVGKAQMVRTLGLSKATYERLMADAQDRDHALYRELAEVGVKVKVEGKKRGSRTYLLKTQG